MAEENIEFAGDFNLPSIVLHNYKNKGRPVDGGNKRGVDIKHMVQEFNIFESMFSGAITGSMVLADTTNLIGNLPIQGTERLFFKLSNKLVNGSFSNTLDFTEKGGHPLHIYKITDREQLNDSTQSYVIHFASREFVRNLRTKVSESFTGRMDQMVNKIFARPEYLDSKKKLYFQKTRNSDTIVVPNVTPFDAIKLLGKRALPDSLRSKGAGYLFFETPRGFHFRSWESLCIAKNGKPREVKQKFRYVQQRFDRFGHEMLDESGKPLDKIVEDFRNVESYQFMNNFHDVAANTALGTYGHRVITHNLYNKSYKISDYHYHNYFNQTKHTDGPNPAIVDTPVDFDDKNVSDYPESRVTVMATTQFAHGEDTGAFGIDVEQDGITEAARVSQLATVSSGTNLKLTVKGQSYLAAGDVINFNILSVENKVASDGALDPQYAGRYIISKIRHRITNDDYIQVLECVKDSVFNAYTTDSEEYYQGHPHLVENVRGQDINQYDDLDEDLEKGRPIRL